MYLIAFVDFVYWLRFFSTNLTDLVVVFDCDLLLLFFIILICFNMLLWLFGCAACCLVLLLRFVV